MEERAQDKKTKRVKQKTRSHCRPNKTNIGGQAVIEGVMMRGATSMATAVRGSNGEITMETARFKSAKEKGAGFRMPFVRGVVNLGTQMFAGTALIMRSAEVYGDFAEPSKFDNWLAKKFKVNSMNLILGFSLVLGVLLAVGLFVFLPNFLSGLIFSIPSFENAHPLLHSLVEGLLMITIFVLYIVIVSLMKDIKRVFMYHGAEHRVISCYESGLELTVENAQKMSTAHSRCGTTFMFFVLTISILIFAFVNWALGALGWLGNSGIINALVKLGVKLLFVPLVAGISYELLKFLAKYDNLFVRILRAPGMWLQKLTTKKPTDDMVECSLAAFNMVLAMEKDPTIATQQFEIKVPYPIARSRIEGILGEYAENSDVDWIFVETTGIKRSELKSTTTIDGKHFTVAENIAKDMAGGKPLQYALSNSEFYGLKIAVNNNVLIPRPETEQLAEKVIKHLDGSQDKTVLDLCTGSGAIALAIAKNSKAKVFASDVSEKAIEVAKGNSQVLGLSIEVAIGDLFQAQNGQSFDVIVCNPPYIKHDELAKLEKKVRNFEPMLALDGGKDGLNFYRRISDEGKSHLNTGGVLFLEIGATQGEDIKSIFKEYSNCVVEKDLQGNERFAIVTK